MEIKDFRSVVDKYKVVFFDAYGVLKNSSGMIDGIQNTFNYLIEKDINFFIVTNDASRGPRHLMQYYQEAGMNMITEDRIISSGMLARDYLKLKVNTGTVAYLGTDQSAHYLQETGLRAVSIADISIDQIDDVNALVFLDDEGFDWQTDLNKVLNLLRLRNIPVIVANTDKTYPSSNKEVAIAIGGIADMVQNIIGRKFIKFGKPDSNMFIYAFEHARKTLDVSKDEVLMVGDTLFTDILGGNKFGIDTALVLTGNTLEKKAAQYILSSGINPDHICYSAGINEDIR